MSHWSRVVIAGVSGAISAYLGGLLGFYIVVWQRSDSQGDLSERVFNVFEVLLFGALLGLVGAVLLWLITPSLLATVLGWPRIGVALALQLGLGIVLVPLLIWFLVVVSADSDLGFGAQVAIALTTAAGIPAFSRWAVERSGPENRAHEISR